MARITMNRPIRMVVKDSPTFYLHVYHQVDARKWCVTQRKGDCADVQPYVYEMKKANARAGVVRMRRQIVVVVPRMPSVRQICRSAEGTFVY